MQGSNAAFNRRPIPLGTSRNPKKTFDAAAAANAHMIVQLKDNQPSLCQTAEAACATALPVSTVQTVDEKRRNRHETRCVAVFDASPAIVGTEWEPYVAPSKLLGFDIEGVEAFMPLSPKCVLYMPCASVSRQIIGGYEDALAAQGCAVLSTCGSPRPLSWNAAAVVSFRAGSTVDILVAWRTCRSRDGASCWCSRDITGVTPPPSRRRCYNRPSSAMRRHQLRRRSTTAPAAFISWMSSGY